MKVDLTNINGLSDIESQVKAFEEEAKKLNAVEEYKKIEADMRSFNRRIEEYEKMKTEKDNTMDYVESARHDGTIKTLIEEEKKKLEEAEKAKTELDKKMSSPEHKKEENELRDRKSAFYTQAAMKLQDEIETLKLDMQLELKVGDPQTKHKNYHAMQDKMNDLQKALSLCEEQKAKVVAEYEAQAKPINDILKATYGEPGKDNPGKDNPGKDNPGKDDSGKDDPGKDNPGKDDPGKDDPGKDDPGKDDSGKDDSGKGNPPAKIAGKRTYQSLGFWNRYKMKRDAFVVAEGLKSNEQLSFGRKLLLMLPSYKYSEMAARMISSKDITAPEGTVLFEQPKEVKKEEPSMWGDLTPEQRAMVNKSIEEMLKNPKTQEETKDKPQEQSRDEGHSI